MAKLKEEKNEILKIFIVFSILFFFFYGC